MREAARLSAAIDCLDAALAGARLEAVLRRWGQANRYAGSGDRAAIRDLVYRAWRCRRSQGWLGGAWAGLETGRALILGGLRADGIDPETLFDGSRFAPAPLTETERQPTPPMPEAVALDLPDWQLPLWKRSMPDGWQATARALQHRAPVCVRVNTQHITRDRAIATLADEGIASVPVAGVPTALTVTEGARALGRSKAFETGLVELQDSASQALALALPLTPNARVLDFCAGGGGKALALAARHERPSLTAYDAVAARMTDLRERARRAGVSITVSETLPEHDSFDLVLCDAPCSGSGSWRRDPEGKWALTPARLAELGDIQSGILQQATRLVRPGGHLAYATCSVFNEENTDIAARFLAHTPAARLVSSERWGVDAPGDGFGHILFSIAEC